MKKRISLILVLLIVFSVLLSTTVSAEKQPQSENEPALDTVFGLTPQEDSKSPCASDPDVPTCTAVLTLAPGAETMACSHIYVLKRNQFTPSGHTYRCTKCGKEKTESHNYKYSYVNSTYHKYHCSKCNYIQSQTRHSFTYQYVNNRTHNQICEFCRHIFSTGSHSGKKVYKDFAWYIICDKCHKYIPQ